MNTVPATGGVIPITENLAGRNRIVLKKNETAQADHLNLAVVTSEEVLCR